MIEVFWRYVPVISIWSRVRLHRRIITLHRIQRPRGIQFSLMHGSHLFPLVILFLKISNHFSKGLIFLLSLEKTCGVEGILSL